MDFLRGHDDHSFTVTAYLDGIEVGTADVTLSGAYDVHTVVFPGPIDEVVWNEECCYWMDNLVYATTMACP
jgi:hypothetical protein